MQYIITSDAVGLAIGPMAETANDVQEALNKARQMCEAGLANVSIEDETGHKIDGDELHPRQTDSPERCCKVPVLTIQLFQIRSMPDSSLRYFFN